jgi:hypothetical protein
MVHFLQNRFQDGSCLVSKVSEGRCVSNLGGCFERGERDGLIEKDIQSDALSNASRHDFGVPGMRAVQITEKDPPGPKVGVGSGGARLAGEEVSPEEAVVMILTQLG